ncbi:MAG: FecR domain-containing protein [Chthoniobacterales bacterium]|nr:FecR domain-containing protein [Chthoniobacterales bacterium]
MASTIFLAAGRRSLRVRALAGAALVTFLLQPGAFAADLTQAVVRQKVNIVTLAPSLSAASQPVAQGAVVRDENVVRTGTESRAELEFPDLTLARMGANSIFSFDAEARAISCQQGAALFSKPTSSGRIEVRAGAVTAAITGSTGFVSNQPMVHGAKARKGTAASADRTTMMGMLEGKLRGTATWRDRNGGQHSFAFKLGPGEMIVAQANRQPVVVQFDIPRFLATSPLITGFSGELPNQAQLNRAVAQYRTDERRGFLQPTNVLVSSQPLQVAWLSSSTVNHNSFDASVDQLGRGMRSTVPGDGGFVDVGGTGILRGQLVWNTSADLDLHLTLPDQQEVFFANRTVTFNNGRATAALDADNLGGNIDVPPSTRVENIVVNGVPLSGNYTFFVNSFSSGNGSDAFTLRVSSNGTVQVINGTLTPGQNSTPIVVPFRPGG